ncbi:MAG: hypothetical protein WBF67_04155, partial [Olleya sp.]
LDRNLIILMKYILLVFLILLFGCNTTPTLLDTYKNEISALKTEAEIDAYWKHLLDLDQNALLKGKYTTKEHDSLSITHMIQTALMFEIHGDKSYKLNNTVIEMHFAHNYFGPSNIAFWPIINKYVELRGDRKLLQYPAYQLEGTTLTFYDYSIYSQKDKQDSLMKNLDVLESDQVSKDLFEALNYQISLRELNYASSIGKWQRQPFKTIKEDGFFELVKMSNNSIYYRKNERLQKLELIKTVENTKFYRVEKEPFGWSFKLKEDGNLSLIDDNETVLISYSKFQ